MTMLFDSWTTLNGLGLLDTAARTQPGALRPEHADERPAGQAPAEPQDEAEPMWREVFPGVEHRPMAGGPAMTIALLRFQRGAVAGLHHHASAQAGYVLEGRIRITLPEEQVTVSAGECYLLPPGVPHQVRALERTHVLDFFAPGEATVEAADVLAGLPAARGGEASDQACAAPAAPRRRPTPGLRPGRTRHAGPSGGRLEEPRPEEPRDAA